MKQIAPSKDIYQTEYLQNREDKKSIYNRVKDGVVSTVAGFNKGNIVGIGAGFLNDKFEHFEAVEGYSPYDDPQLENLREFIPSKFWNSKSPQESSARLQELKQEVKDMSNPMYIIGRLGGEFTDVTMLFNILKPFKAVKNAIYGSKAGTQTQRLAKAIAAEEGAKQLLDPDRAIEDAVIVGGFAFYFNHLGKKLSKYEDSMEMIKNMKFYEEGSNAEIPITLPNTRANKQKEIRTPKNYDELVNNYKTEYPDANIRIEPGIGGRLDPPNINAAAFYRKSEGIIYIDPDKVKDLYNKKKYTKPRVEGVIPFKEGDFESEAEFTDFVIRHELAHRRLPQKTGESKAAYENRINEVAYNQIKDNRKGKIRTGSLILDEVKIAEAERVDRSLYKNAIDKEVKLTDLDYINTYTFVEKLGWNPMDRMVNRKNRLGIEFSLNMLKNSLYMKMAKNGDVKPDSAEMIKDVVYGPVLLSFLEDVRSLFGKYLESVGKKDPKNFVYLQFDLANVYDKEKLTFAEFKTEIPFAILNGYKHSVPEVEAAARSAKNFFSFFGKKIDELGVYLIQPTKELDHFNFILNQMRGKRTTKYEYTDELTGKKITYGLKEVEARVKGLTNLINDVKNSGQRPNYFSVLYRFDVITKRWEDFQRLIVPQLRAKGLDNDAIDDVLDTFKNYKPYETLDSRDADIFPGEEYKFKPSSYSKFLRSRTLNINYEPLMREGFIETDISLISQQYFKSIVPDLVLTEKFGDPFASGMFYEFTDGFAPGLQQIYKDFQTKINKAKTPAERKALQIERNEVLEDAEAMRDLFKGRYGLVDNPHRLFSRSLRLMKSWNNLRLLTGSFAALPDIARLMTANGLQKSMGTLLDLFSNSMTKDLLRMGFEQGRRAGQIFDLILSVNRSSIISGTNLDMFSNFNQFERFVQRAEAFNFQYINAMNAWTVAVKSIASVDIGSNIIAAALRVKNGVATEVDLMKFADFGVSNKEAIDIADAYLKHGYGKDANSYKNIDFKSIHIANTDKWADSKSEINAGFRFNRMLNEETDIVIVTPSLGETPLWMSKEIGSTIAQYKKFGMAFTRRAMQRGIQEDKLNFLATFASLLALGMLVDAVRTEQTGGNYSKKKLREKLLDGFDRGGLGGIFTDINRIVETATNNQIGLRPLFGVGKPYGTSLARKAGILGPTASTYANIMEVLYDWGRGKHTHHTARRIRKLVPLNNIWYLDSIFDKLEKGIR